MLDKANRPLTVGLLVATLALLGVDIYRQWGQPAVVAVAAKTSEQCASDCGPGGWVLVQGLCGCYGGPAEPECAE